MKYVILIGDGMSDESREDLGNKTLLQYCETPNMDALAKAGRVGMFNTIPEGYPPGSDVCIMSILGYSPVEYYTGRAPFEAASLGVKLEEGEVCYRANMVSLSGEGDDTVMADYSAGHITTEDAGEAIDALNEAFKDDDRVRFHRGTQYRHLMLIKNIGEKAECTPPHDISDKLIKDHYPKGDGEAELKAIIDKSRQVLKGIPMNERRKSDGKNTADSIWLWGQGKAPSFKTYDELYGLSGAMISAVDLTKGLGVYAGLNVMKVEGATGYIDTNYEGKVNAAKEVLENHDFVCVHVEAPDEAGHQGSLEDKITAINDFDLKVVGPMLEHLRSTGEDFRVLVQPDHPTPVRLKTHTVEPVPFIMYEEKNGQVTDYNDGTNNWGKGDSYSEVTAKASGLFIEGAPEIVKAFYPTL